MESQSGRDIEKFQNPNPNPNLKQKAKIVVVMGASGTGKSKLAIDMASHFPIEIINADSMQVYNGLDVLTNKLPFSHQKGVAHHLLGTISPTVEFTSKHFRDSAIPIVDDILSRDRLPVIVGGTNYYIQALVSPFLLDESTEVLDESYLNDHHGENQADDEPFSGSDSCRYNYDRLKEVDPVAANRIHPNNHRKINQYLSLYSRSGILPSELFQGQAVENWGRADNFRYDCCFICVEASLPVLDKYVEQRVDDMIDAGLLDEVCDIYNPNTDYTRGLQQAIGVREFEEFLQVYLVEGIDSTAGSQNQVSLDECYKVKKENMRTILKMSSNNQYKILLQEAIDKVKTNTRRLVRRQKRRLDRLETLFGWNIHFVDVTQSLLSYSDDSWKSDVVEPSINLIRSFLNEDACTIPNSEAIECIGKPTLTERDLWTQFVCEACGNKVLRGAHEWDQHKKGRGHRKRIFRLKKSQTSLFVEAKPSS